MRTWKDTFKDLFTNLTEFAWLLFAGFQWLIAFFLILMPVGLIISLPTGSVAVRMDNRPVLSDKGLFLLIFLWAAMMAFAVFYFVKIRRQPEPATHRKFQIMFAYAAVAWILTNEIQLAEKDYILDHLYYSTTTIQPYDAETRQVINGYSISGFGQTSVAGYHLENMTSSGPEGMTLHRLDIAPVEVTVRAKGYQPESLVVGADSGHKIIPLYLKREADPNSVSENTSLNNDRIASARVGYL